MKHLILLLLSIGIPATALPAARTLSLSPTFRLSWPQDFAAKPVHLPSMSAYTAKGEYSGSVADLHVLRQRPATIANRFSVERYWNDNRGVVKAVTKNEHNEGCLPLKPGLFTCRRQFNQDGKYVAEMLVWSMKADLVLVRATSAASRSHAKKLLAAVAFEHGPVKSKKRPR